MKFPSVVLLIGIGYVHSSGTCARKLKLESTTGKPIQMFEFQAFSSDGVNMALNKASTQSSDLKAKFDSSKAVDGKLDSFSHTAGDDATSWWQLDLGEDEDINHVNVVNRYCGSISDPANCMGRLSYATLSLIDYAGNTVHSASLGDTTSLLNVHVDLPDASCAMPSSMPTTNTTRAPSAGSTCSDVTKVKIEATTGKVIQMFEVQVFSAGANVALNKISTQSSDFKDNFDSSKAVDGNLESFSHTSGADLNGWWSVDLQEDFSIEEVVIHNRWCRSVSDPANCMGRLSYANISLIDEQGIVKYSTSLGNTTSKQVITVVPVCGSDDEPSPSGTPSVEPSPNPSSMPTTTNSSLTPTKAPSSGSSSSPSGTPSVVPSPNPSSMPTTTTISFGSLSNWDTYCVVPNATGYEECHGFEIELEDLPCSSVYYTFSYNRYGTPSKTDTATGCIVSYESGYDDVNNQWLVTTPVPQSLLEGGKVMPTGGHSCFSSGQADYSTSGCEHFGISIGSGVYPKTTKYRWLVADKNAPGTLVQSSTRIGIPAVTWSVQAGAGGGGGNVVAAVIEAEPPEQEDEQNNCACWKWGEPRYVKVFTTEIEYEVDLDHLLTDSEDVPQSKSETEIEWILLQGRPRCDEDCTPIAYNETEDELELSNEVDDSKKSIIRRYEFYEYSGEVDPEDNEAKPESECESHPDADECQILGNYLGAQMAAAIIEHGNSLKIATQSPVMAGKKDVQYILMLTAIGGTPPYTWSCNNEEALLTGLAFSSDGFISGTPTEAGNCTLDIIVHDSDTSVEKSLFLTIAN